MHPVAFIQVENTLSWFAGAPLLGILPGAVKSIAGVVQATIGAGMSLVGCCSNDEQWAGRGWILLKNGGGNVLAGLIEGFPGAGTALLIARYRWARGEASDATHPSSSLYKFVDYSGWDLAPPSEASNVALSSPPSSPSTIEAKSVQTRVRQPVSRVQSDGITPATWPTREELQILIGSKQPQNFDNINQWGSVWAMFITASEILPGVFLAPAGNFTQPTDNQMIEMAQGMMISLVIEKLNSGYYPYDRNLFISPCSNENQKSTKDFISSIQKNQNPPVDFVVNVTKHLGDNIEENPYLNTNSFNFTSDSGDIGPEDLTPEQLKRCVLEVYRHLMQGESILIRCQQGKDRSATVLFALLFSIYGEVFKSNPETNNRPEAFYANNPLGLVALCRRPSISLNAIPQYCQCLHNFLTKTNIEEIQVQMRGIASNPIDG